VPSAFGHVAPALALVPLFRTAATPARLWLAGVVCAVAPDLDVLALRFVPHDSMLGHRGLTHSLPFAAALAGVALFAALPRAGPARSWLRAWLYLFPAAASHGLLDACTNGGRGVAFFAPFSAARFFFPFRPIEVSPIDLARFFSERGLEVLRSELVWVWLPCALLAVLATAVRAALFLRGE
jgi:inner membrane protein